MSNAVLNKFMNMFGMGAEESEEEEYDDVNEVYEDPEEELEPKGLFGRKNSKVVNMAAQVRMVIMQPTSFEQSEEICDLLKEKTIEQALLIKDYDIISALGELPLDKIHCAITVTDAIKSAIDNYYERKAKEQKKEEKAKIKAMKDMFNFN